jgi:hypothetical protein
VRRVRGPRHHRSAALSGVLGHGTLLGLTLAKSMGVSTDCTNSKSTIPAAIAVSSGRSPQAVTTFLKGYTLPEGDRQLLFVKPGNPQSLSQMILVGC